VAGVTIMLVRGQDMKYAVPFGPFLSLGAVAYLFFGAWLSNLVLPGVFMSGPM
jgi:leader peptidase (prepilin peptidase)/N-methyltransferase